MTQTTHGGRREGAGRPLHNHPQSLIRIEASEAEQQEIQAWLTPRQRTAALLDAAAVERLRGENDGGDGDSREEAGGEEGQETGDDPSGDEGGDVGSDGEGNGDGADAPGDVPEGEDDGSA